MNHHYLTLTLMRAVTPVIALVTISIQTCATTLEEAKETSLHNFLTSHLTNPHFGADKTTRYFPVFLNLTDGGKENVLVYVTGQTWCGSGGCALLILEQGSSSYRVVTRVRIARPPIIVYPKKTGGWHDLGVFVQGGGTQPGYEAELPYNGKSYPTNPSVPPARRSRSKNGGEVVVPRDAEGTLLYQ